MPGVTLGSGDVAQGRGEKRSFPGGDDVIVRRMVGRQGCSVWAWPEA